MEVRTSGQSASTRRACSASAAFPFENDQRAQHARRLRPRDHLFEIAAELLIRQVTVGVNHDAAHSPLVSS